jgi:hypothetical protein
MRLLTLLLLGCLVWEAKALMSHKKVFKCAHNHMKHRHNFKPFLINKPGDTAAPNYWKLAGLSRSISPASNFRKIRIKFEPIGMEGADPNKRLYLMQTILGDIKTQLENLIQVGGQTKIPAFTQTGCFDESFIPRKYKIASTDTDLILFVAMQDMDLDLFAFATSCLLSDADYRPVVGLVVVNSQHLEFDPWNIEVSKATLLHEIMHVLVFDPQLFDLFPIGAQRTYRVERRRTSAGVFNATKIILPSVVEYARKFYDCSNANGVYLENEGGEGSVGAHWERYYLGNELMTAESTGNGVLSMFTIGMLKDCGWYRVNEDMAQYFAFGRGAGCGFLGEGCNPAFPEFCPLANRLKCNRDRTTKTFCLVSQFTDKCPISLPIPELDCTSKTNFLGYTDIIKDEPGPNSRCIDVKIQKFYEYSACFRIECGWGSSFSVFINGNKTVCSQRGQVISTGIIDYICPDHSEVCQKPHCPKMCNGNGKCLENGDCMCDYFWRGERCGIRQSCHNGDNSICSLILPPNYGQQSQDPTDTDDGDSDSGDGSDDPDGPYGPDNMDPMTDFNRKRSNYVAGNVFLFFELICALTIGGIAAWTATHL